MACKSKRLDWAPIFQQEKDTLKEKMEGREAIAKEVRKLAEEDCEFRVVLNAIVKRFDGGDKEK